MSLVHFAFIFPIRIFTILVKSLFHSWFKLRWVPTSKSWLMQLDHKIRTRIQHKNCGQWVEVHQDRKSHEIWTVFVEGDQRDNVPMVLVHGVTGGCNLFLNNIDSLAKHRDIYMLDLPGFGLSSKPQFRVKFQGDWWVNTDGHDIERFYTQILENWFIKMRLNKFILLGHGFGGYVSSVYSMTYPARVAHLILNEPWGFKPEPLNADDRPFRKNKSISLLSDLYAKLYLYTPIRALGPIALPLFRVFRLGLKERFQALWAGLDPEVTSLDRVKQLMVEERAGYFPDMTMQDYCYVWMMNSKSGEIAFDRLAVPNGWPVNPLEDRTDQWVDNLDLTFIFGSKSWVNKACGSETKNHRHDSYVDVHEIGGAGHHLFADRPSAFNSIVQMIGEAVDKGKKPTISDDSMQRKQSMSQLRRRLSLSLSESAMDTDESLLNDLIVSEVTLSSRGNITYSTDKPATSTFGQADEPGKLLEPKKSRVVFTLEPEIEELDVTEEEGINEIRKEEGALAQL